MSSPRDSCGFTLAELLVALVLSAIVVSAVAALTATTDGFARSQSRVMDAQQRARVIAETLGRDLRLAGAGLDRGPMSGPLNRVFTPLWPRRVGRVRPDAATVVRPDALTLVWVPDTIVQTTLAIGDVPSLGRILLVPCAGGALPCQVARGATLAVFDAPGRAELLGVLDDDVGGTTVRPLGAPAGAFAAGSIVSEVVIRGYYFDSALAQLRFYDGDGTDQPVVDEVTGLTFEYFGDPAPPQLPRPDPGVENCLFDMAGTWRGGVTLTANSEGLAALPLSMFLDGPWCSAGGTSFDADLLRVRRVRVEVRLKASGPRDPRPDYRAVFDVSPANLSRTGPGGGPGGSW
jgi:prepilin-type N-terminal cleavage/methylation domain-containing protein